MQAENDTIEDNLNPLDSVEEILSSNNWVFSRMNNDELMVQVRGQSCEYRLFFIWQEDMNAMQFCCQFDQPVSRANYENAARVILGMNEKLWMGHFDLPRDTMIPAFRHTCLFHGMPRGAGSEQIQDLVQISLAQCERYYPLFSLMNATDRPVDEQNLQLALMESAGNS